MLAEIRGRAIHVEVWAGQILANTGLSSVQNSVLLAQQRALFCKLLTKWKLTLFWLEAIALRLEARPLLSIDSLEAYTCLQPFEELLDSLMEKIVHHLCSVGATQLSHDLQNTPAEFVTKPNQIAITVQPQQVEISNLRVFKDPAH